MVDKWGVVCYLRGQRKDFYDPLPLPQCLEIEASGLGVIEHRSRDAWHTVRKACRLNWMYNGWKPVFRLPNGQLVDVFDFGEDDLDNVDE